MPRAADPDSTDVLSEVLSVLGVRGELLCRSELGSPWALRFAAAPRIHFHAVERGACWLRIKGAPPERLDAGDLVLLPHGDGHELHVRPGGRAVRMEEVLNESGHDHAVFRYGGSGDPTVMLCGAFHIAHPEAHPFLSFLPPIVRASVNDATANWLGASLKYLEQEAITRSPGVNALISRLTEIVLVQTLRSWMASDSDFASGWLAALQDPSVGRALALMHAGPGTRWSVESLARRVGMSRSPFAVRFRRLVGASPLAYLSRLRMQTAARMLSTVGASGVPEVAARVGYDSEAAFSRAFKKAYGMPPATYRRSRRGKKATTTSR